MPCKSQSKKIACQCSLAHALLPLCVQVLQRLASVSAASAALLMLCYLCMQVPQRLASLEAVAGLVAEARVAAEVKDADEGKEFGRGKRVR